MENDFFMRSLRRQYLKGVKSKLLRMMHRLDTVSDAENRAKARNVLNGFLNETKKNNIDSIASIAMKMDDLEAFFQKKVLR